MPELKVDVVIVGAGFSGLAAAERLVTAKRSVVVLEALGRVGGKVYEAHFKTPTVSGYVEAGASFIGPGQSEVAGLAEKLGLSTFNTYDQGKTVFCLGDGQRRYFDPTNPEFAAPPLPTEAVMQLMGAIMELDAMACDLDINAPWNHPKATEWDSKTLQTWLDSTITQPEAMAVQTLTWRSLLSAEPSDVSLLQAVTYIARGTDGDYRGNWQRLTAVHGGAQEQRIEGGSQLIAIKLAEQLAPDVVRLNSPVRGVAKKGDGYHVYVEAGLDGPRTTIQARNIILAISPPLVSRIRFEPPLPARRDLAGQRMAMGSLGKAIAVYKTPFWREEGLNGHAVCLRGSTVQLSFDDSPSDGSYGALMGFLEANDARRLDDLTDEEIQKLVLKDYVSFFGPKAAEVEHWVIQRWNREEYARGGHFALCPPNVMTVYGENLAQPVDGIFFAGTELSNRWSGFMEGAVIAGRNAADDVINHSNNSSLGNWNRS